MRKSRFAGTIEVGDKLDIAGVIATVTRVVSYVDTVVLVMDTPNRDFMQLSSRKGTVFDVITE